MSETLTPVRNQGRASRRRIAGLLVLLGTSAIDASAAHGQTIRGTVLGPDDVPVVGAVLQLVDSASSVVARTLSGTTGAFVLRASAPAVYRLRALRIGYAPELLGLVALRVGTDTTIRVALSGRQIVLDTIRVAERRACRGQSDSADVVFRIWDRARTAFALTDAATASRAMASVSLLHAKRLDPSGRRVLDETYVVMSDSGRVWASVAADSLHAAGYVARGAGDSTIYRAPSLDVLASDRFAEDHCFRLRADRDSPLIDISFEPTPARRSVPEITGTLSVDRATLELRRLQFGYTNLPRGDPGASAGGEIDFLRLRSGAWAIARWAIRMPMLEQRQVGGTDGRTYRTPTLQTQVAGLSQVGGELLVALQDADTLWVHPGATLSGVVVDSTTGRSIANARIAIRGQRLEARSDAAGRFTFVSLRPGEYVLEVRTASLDSLTAMSQTALTFAGAPAPVTVRVPGARQVAMGLCGAGAVDRSRQIPGILMGVTTIGEQHMPVAGAYVVATWTAPGDSVTRRMSARTDEHGRFRLCGVPIEVTLVLTASTDSADATPQDVHLASNVRFSRTTVPLRHVAAGASVLAGVVVSDATREPIGDADIAAPDVGIGTRSSASGTFRLSGLPPGPQRIVVRRVGYGPAEITIEVRAGERLERRFALLRAVRLDSVVVTERENRSFDEHRRLGLGHFIIREEIEKREGTQLSSFLEQVPGLRLGHGRGSQAWALGSRVRSIGCQGCYIPEQHEAAQGMRMECYALVYLDGVLMNRPQSFSTNGHTYRAAPPFDVNAIATTQIQAIEYYAGPAQTPLKYSGLDTSCGVLVLWTRR